MGEGKLEKAGRASDCNSGLTPVKEKGKEEISVTLEGNRRVRDFGGCMKGVMYRFALQDRT